MVGYHEFVARLVEMGKEEEFLLKWLNKRESPLATDTYIVEAYTDYLVEQRKNGKKIVEDEPTLPLFVEEENKQFEKDLRQGLRELMTEMHRPPLQVGERPHVEKDVPIEESVSEVVEEVEEEQLLVDYSSLAHGQLPQSLVGEEKETNREAILSNTNAAKNFYVDIVATIGGELEAPTICENHEATNGGELEALVTCEDIDVVVVGDLVETVVATIGGNFEPLIVNEVEHDFATSGENVETLTEKIVVQAKTFFTIDEATKNKNFDDVDEATEISTFTPSENRETQ